MGMCKLCTCIGKYGINFKHTCINNEDNTGSKHKTNVKYVKVIYTTFWLHWGKTIDK